MPIISRGARTIGAMGDAFDGEETWREMYALGYRMIMGNMTIDFIKFAADVSGFN